MEGSGKKPVGIERFARYVRLNAIYRLVPECNAAADIGTDHGFLPLMLVGSGKAKHVIATDLRPGPLARAKARVEKEGRSEEIELRLGDGLTVLSPGEADVIVIAGMGGKLIAGMLEASRETASEAALVLSPHRDAYDVRRWLSEHGYAIDDETMASEDGKFYPVISARKSRSVPALSETELRYGPVLLKTRPDAFTRYLKEERDKLTALQKKLSESATERSKRSLFIVEEELRNLPNT